MFAKEKEGFANDEDKFAKEKDGFAAKHITIETMHGRFVTM